MKRAQSRAGLWMVLLASALLIALVLLPQITQITGFASVEQENKIIIEKNKITAINMSSYLPGVERTYLATSPSNMDVQTKGSLLVLSPDKGFTGERIIKVFVADQEIQELVFRIEVVDRKNTILEKIQEEQEQFKDDFKWPEEEAVVEEPEPEAEPEDVVPGNTLYISKSQELVVDLASYFESTGPFVATGDIDLIVNINSSLMQIRPYPGFVGEEEITVSSIGDDMEEHSFLVKVLGEGEVPKKEKETPREEKEKPREGFEKQRRLPGNAAREREIRVGSKRFGEKLEDEPGFEVYFRSITQDNETLRIIFYHDSNSSEKVYVEGDINYTLSHNFTGPYENATLEVILDDGIVPEFELHVGNDSEKFKFGKKIPKVWLQGKRIEKWKDKLKDKTWYRIIDRDDGFVNVLIRKGNSTAYIKGVSADDIKGLFRWVRNTVLTTEIFAADPIEMEEAWISLPREDEVTAIVECADFDLESEACPGDWIVTGLAFKKTGTHINFTVDHFSAYGGGNIAVIDVQSYPTLYGNWTVRFNTTGTADLTITAINGTSWTDYADSGYDLKFLEVKCGNQVLNYSWVNGSVFIPDYHCDALGYETSKVLTAGRHALEFRFGSDVDYAYNYVFDRDYDMATEDNISWYGTPGSITGVSLDWADINNDGYADAIVGAPGFASNNGAVYIFYGPIDVVTDTLITSKANATLQGDSTYYTLGSCLGSGDINNDGFDDLIIGSIAYNQVFVVYGRSANLPSLANISTVANATITDSSVSFLGDQCDSGDINGDGYDDLLIGNWVVNYNSRGRVYLIYGRGASYSGNYSISNIYNESWTGAYDGFSTGEHAYVVRTAGDVNNDGYDEILIGAPYWFNGEPYPGRAYLIYGQGQSFNRQDYTLPSGTNATFTESNAYGDLIGWSVSSAGDVNNDDYDDFLISAPDADKQTLANNGQIYLFYGGPGLPWNGSYTDIDNDANATFTGVANNFESGMALNLYNYAYDGALSYGDFNADGYSDFIIGVTNDDVWDTRPSAGRVVLFYGKQALFSGDHWLNLSDADATFYGEGYGSGDHLSSVPTGMAEGVVSEDIMMAAMTYNSSGGVPSCPFLYAWNSTGYGFVNDIYPSSDMFLLEKVGRLLDTAYVKSPFGLAPKDGYYEVKMREEQEEISSTDYLYLMTIDHPPGMEVYPSHWYCNDCLYTTDKNLSEPVSCVDNLGNDCLDVIKSDDNNVQKMYENDYIIVDLGNLSNAEHIKLVLKRGYVGFSMLQRVEVRDENNSWKTISPSIFTPTPTTFNIQEFAALNVLNLTGLFPTDNYELRIFTEDRTLFGKDWDEKIAIDFIGVDTSEPSTNYTVNILAPVYADLHPGTLHHLWDAGGNFDEPGYMLPAYYQENAELRNYSSATRNANNVASYGSVLQEIASDECNASNIYNCTGDFVTMPADEVTVRYDYTPPAQGMERDFIFISNGAYKEQKPMLVGKDIFNYPEGHHSDEGKVYIMQGNNFNNPPTQGKPILNSTSGNNLTSDNLTVYPQNVTDPDNDSVTNITQWFKEGRDYSILNMPFDSNSSATAKDYSTYGNDGSVNGATWTSAGILGGAYDFDGVDDYINVSYSQAINLTGNFTVSFWMKPSSCTAGQSVINQDNVGSCRIFDVYYCNSAVEHNQFYIFNTSGNCFNTDFVSYVGQWQYVVNTYNGNTISSYVNGTLKHSVAVKGGLKNCQQPIIMGMRGSSAPYNGTIDELRIYKHALTPQQVAAEYNAGAPNYRTIVSQETDRGEVWYSELTPNDGKLDGAARMSNGLQVSSAPTQAAPVLSSSSGLNITTDDLLLSLNVSDIDGDSVYNTTNWFRNGKSITVLNLPFEGLRAMHSVAGSSTLLAMYFENNTKDFSGYGNDGSCTNCPAYTANGKVGGAYDFDGVDDTVLLSSDIALGNTDWAFSVWVKTGKTAWSTILTNKDGGPVYNVFQIKNSVMSYRHYNGSWQEEFGTINVTDSNWHLLAWVNNGSSQTVGMYVDGILDVTRNSKLAGGTGLVNRFGSWYGSLSNLFNGTMDEVHIFNRTLSSTDVLALYKKGFDSNTEVYDYSPYRNKGAVNGATWTSAGIYGGAYAFDGVNDYITNATAINTALDAESAGTISAWVYLNGCPDAIIAGRIGPTGNWFDGRMVLYTRSSCVFGFNIANGSVSNPQIGTPSSSGVWKYLVGTFNGTWYGLYEDGVLKAQNTYSATQVKVAGTPLNIGYWNGLGYFNGTIDEVRIYNHSLSPEQIASEYNAGSPNYNKIVHQETAANDTWYAESTPNDGIMDGAAVRSNNLTIYDNRPPTQGKPVLNSTFGTNKTTENLTVYPQNVFDPDNDSVINITNWFKEGRDYSILNMPFDTDSSVTAKDYSTYGNDGTVNGAAWTSAGILGGAYDFNGVNNDINVGSSNLFNFISENYSVSAWVKPESTALSWLAIRGAWLASGWGISFEGSANLPKLWHWTAGLSHRTVANFNVPTGVWTHLVFTRNGTVGKIYINGTEANYLQQEAMVDPASHSGNLYVARASWGQYFNGTIDELKIYRHTLTPQQVAAEYNAGSPDYRTIVSQETDRGEVWYSELTPNDGKVDGIAKLSNGLQVSSAPTQTTPVLSAGLNRTIDNLLLSLNVSDIDGDAVYNITNWFRNGKSITVLNLPFEGLRAMHSKATADVLTLYFENNTKDFSGYGNDGSCTNCPAYTANGKVGGAYDFDGVNDYVNITSLSQSFNFTDYTRNWTMSSWIFVKGLTTGNSVLAFGTADYQALTVGIYTNKFFTIGSTTGSDWDLWAQSTQNVAIGKWYHFVVTNNAGVIRQYINGGLDGTDTIASNLVQNNNIFKIGYHYKGLAGNHFNGTIDEVHIFNRSLSSTEITALYKKGFDSNTEAYDYSPYRNKGAVNGATWTSAGILGGAYEFDGVDDDILLGNVAAFKTANKTISFWASGSGLSASDSHRMIFSSGYSNYYISAYQQKIFLSWNNGTNGQRTFFTTATVDNNVWNHFAVVYSVIGNTVNISTYKNGVLNSSYQNTEGYSTTYGSAFRIGTYTGADYLFNGSIDEFRIYNHSLSPEQVASEYNAGAPNYNKIVHQETAVNDTWYAEATPNDGVMDGITKQSNNVTIYGNRPPTQGTPILNSSFGGNTSVEDLTVWPQNVFDPDNLSVKNITNWRMNGTSIFVLNLPFEGGSTSGTVLANGTTRDYSGLGNNGTVVQAQWSNSTGFDGWGAYAFNGSALINAGNSSTLTAKDISFAAWIKLNSLANPLMQPIIRRTTNIFPASVPYEFYVTDDDLTFRYQAGLGSGSVVKANAFNQTGKWYFIAATRKVVGGKMNSNVTLHLFVDGQLVASNVVVSKWPDSGGTTFIGGDTFSYFNGSIDEVWIINRTLTDQQIKSFYQRGPNTIKSQETQVGDVWQACLTPNDRVLNGQTKCSNNLTIQPFTCGFTITASVALDSNLVTAGDCIVIGADDVLLDCAGYSITGGGAGTGVRATGRSNATIQNCNFFSFANDVLYDGTDSSRIDNTDVIINITNANNTNVTNSNITALYVTNSNNTQIINCTTANYTLANALIFALDTLAYGKVKFLQSLTESGLSLDSDVNITFNKTFVDSANEPGLNVSAEITLRNLSFASTPNIYADRNDDGIYEEKCVPPTCYALSYAGGTFVFNSTHFTSYVANMNMPPLQGTPILNSTYGTNSTSENLTVWPQNVTDPDGGVVNISNWEVNNKSITVLNLPFDTNLSSNATRALRDYTPYQNNGTLGNGFSIAVPTWISGGILGGAYDFDGVNDQINVSDANSLDLNNDFSIGFWIKLRNNLGDPILGKAVSGGMSDGYNYLFSASSNQVGFAIVPPDAGAGTWSVSTPANLPQNTWVYIVGTFDNSTRNMSIYANGTLVNSVTRSLGSPPTSNLDIAIGRTPYGATVVTQFFNGSIDEVRIYNRTLSAEQVRGDYNNGAPTYTTIVSQELAGGDVWRACLTPNDGILDGQTKCSNNLTVLPYPFCPGNKITGLWTVSANYATTTNITCKVINITNNAVLYINSSGGGNVLIKIEAENLTVNAGSAINSDYLGYSGGIAAHLNGYGPGGGGGFSGGTAGHGAGGSHGGDGGYATSPLVAGGKWYDSAFNPVLIGSGGGSAGSTYNGGDGGGAMKIVATDTLTVAGQITADGQTPPNGLCFPAWGWYFTPGGGGGGTVWIIADVFTGAGTVSADGGNAYTCPTLPDGGGGGGGRVIVFYNTTTWNKNDFITKASAFKGLTQAGSTTASDGDFGTVAFIDPANNIFITDGFTWTQSDYNKDNSWFAWNNFTAGNASSIRSNMTLQINVSGIINITDSVWNGNAFDLVFGVQAQQASILNSNMFDMDNVLFNAPSISLVNSTVVSVPNNATNQIKLNASSITLQTGSELRGNSNITSVNVSIDASSVLNATGFGFSGGTDSHLTGYGPGGGGGFSGVSAGHGAGGSHGGDGGYATAPLVSGGLFYGSSFSPVLMGSGGGGAGGGSSYFGGDGGGIVKISAAGILSFAGQIAADGETAPNGLCMPTWGWYRSPGGGGGGYVLINAYNLTGAGNISADGGDAYNCSGLADGGGGGGGRIAVYYNITTLGVSDFLKSSAAKGLTGSSGNAKNGTDGTIAFIDNTNDAVFIVHYFKFQANDAASGYLNRNLFNITNAVLMYNASVLANATAAFNLINSTLEDNGSVTAGITGASVSFDSNSLINVSGILDITYNAFSDIGAAYVNGLGLVLERMNLAEVVWHNASLSNIFNLSVNVRLGNQSAFVNSTSGVGLNQSANITFFGVNQTSPAIFWDPEDDHTFVPCPANVCTQINYSGTTFLFNVTRFTNYSLLGGGAGPTVRTTQGDVNIINFRLDNQIFEGEFETVEGECENCSYDQEAVCQLEQEVIGGQGTFNMSLFLNGSTGVSMDRLELVCGMYAYVVNVLNSSNCSGSNDTSYACANWIGGGNTTVIDLTNASSFNTSILLGNITPAANCSTVVCWLEGEWEPGDDQEFNITKQFTVTDGTNNATNPNGTLRFTTDKYAGIETMHPDINVLNLRLDFQEFNGTFDTTAGSCVGCSYDLSNGTCQAEIEKIFGMFLNYNLSMTLTTASAINLTSLSFVCRTANETAALYPGCTNLFNPYGTGQPGCMSWVATPGRSTVLPGNTGLSIDLTNFTNITIPLGTISPTQSCKIIACEINGTWRAGETQSFVMNKTITVTAI